MWVQVHEKRKLTPDKVRDAPGAAWRCDPCQVWWGSQVGERRKTAFLLRMPERVRDELPWDEYRGWREKLHMAPVCPQCGRRTGRVVYAAS